MANTLTIVMYHFVRDAARSRFPEIKALRIETFKGQVDYLRRCHTIISAETLIEAIAGEAKLPPKAALLTFDDGYADHYLNVFPILDALKHPALFFPPAQAIAESKVLDVNKIHFILATEPDKAALLEQLFAAMDRYRSEFALLPDAHYRAAIDISGNRWDDADTAFFKRMLQRELPEPARARIVDDLFRELVTQDETAFARELYLDVDQIGEMQAGGMAFGSHGYSHAWLNRLPPAEQEREIDLSLAFLARAGAPTDRWIISYPFGGWNHSLLDIVRRKGGVAGMTTEAREAALGSDDPLLLPRLNTNDLPVSG